MQTADKDLVLQTLAGDHEAFGQLVERYERGVCAVIVQIVGDTHQAQDLAQESFVQAYAKLADLRQPAAFGAWLYRIARRSALNWLRKQGPVAAPLHDGLSTRSNNGRLDEISEKLLHVVMTLPRQEQRVVMLRYFEGHSIREVASILERPVSTVTKQLSRARVRLRQRMEALADE